MHLYEGQTWHESTQTELNLWQRYLKISKLNVKLTQYRDLFDEFSSI